MWILTAFPVIRVPMILTEFPQRKNCGSFFKKHNFDEQVHLFDIYRRFFSRLHLAVGHHHRRRTPRCPHRLQPSRVKVLLTICILAPESTTNSLSSGSFVDAAGSTHSCVGERNVTWSFSLSLHMYSSRFHALLRAHRCCLSVSSDRSSNFIA